MSEERFNELLAGALHHPYPRFTITRLAQALYDVVLTCGKPAEDALEAWCRQRDTTDAQDAEAY